MYKINTWCNCAEHINNAGWHESEEEFCSVEDAISDGIIMGSMYTDVYSVEEIPDDVIVDVGKLYNDGCLPMGCTHVMVERHPRHGTTVQYLRIAEE